MHSKYPVEHPVSYKIIVPQLQNMTYRILLPPQLNLFGKDLAIILHFVDKVLKDIST